MSIAKFFKAPATLRRSTRVSDGEGGWTRTWAPVAIPELLCHWRAASSMDAREGEMGRQERYETTHIVYFPLGTDVKRDDLLEITGGPKGRVVRTRMPGGPRATYMTVDLAGKEEGGT